MTLWCLVWERKTGCLWELSTAGNIFSGANRELPEDMLQKLKDIRHVSLGYLGENYTNEEGILVNDICHEIYLVVQSLYSVYLILIINRNTGNTYKYLKIILKEAAWLESARGCGADRKYFKRR